MPLTSPLPHRGLPWLAAAIPLVLGVAIMHWQAGQALQADALQTATEAVEQLDLMLDSVALAAREVVPLAGNPCADTQLPLRDQVTRGPFVRSVNLAYADRLYCSSLFGPFSEVVNPADYVDGRLWLMPGNAVTPGQALLVYRDAVGPRSALATLDGYHLSNALRLIGRGQELALQVGPHWLDQQGQVQSGPLPHFALAPVQVFSGRYALSLHSGFAEGATWQLIRERYLALFGLLVFLGAAAGLACSWLLKRTHSPRQELQRALHAEEFEAFFQPVLRGPDLQWAGAEVLMRWRHPRDGLVRPDLFIPFAEDCGLIIPMTQLIMRQAARQLAPLAKHFKAPLHFGFNITARHCQAPGLLDDCRAFLDAFPAGSVLLVLELTERELLEPTAQTHQLFEDLHRLGVLIAIDDFGTGHSSLGYLREFKVDILKIDQSFVAMIGGDALSGHILDSIIDLSNKLGLQIVAEGVETEAQRDYLVARQVDYLQGYLFDRPMAGAAFVEALAARSK